MKKIISVLLSLALCLGMCPPIVLAAEDGVSYQEASWNGGVTYTTKTAESCTPVTDSTTAWNAGWYVVNSTVIISEPITVTGAVNLILADGCALNAEKGIVVPSDASLTIYAQTGGTGTLNATGTADSDNASAGIGGSTSSLDSGTITIHGGEIKATGGVVNNNFGAPNYGGAGIGGGSPRSGNGGSSGAITIYGGTITANSGTGNLTGAGIGGGGGNNGGTGSNITIYGGNVTAEAHNTSLSGSGAGIGGGFGSKGGGAGSVTIFGGTVHATGGYYGAGIGGGGGGSGAGQNPDSSLYQSGSGTGITISGGIVTAVGGQFAAGIGGGGGYYSSYTVGSTTYGSGCIGGTGSVTISGGIVDAKGGAGNSSGNYAGDPIGNGGNTTATATVEETNAIVFENGAGTVCGDVTLDGSYTVPAGYTLNIPAGASLSGSGTLSGGSAFTTENLTADMISVPTNLYYNGEDRTADITTELSGELTTGVTICGQTFTVSGWTLAVEKTDDLTYTATYTNNNDNTNTFTQTITLLKSGTDLTSEGKVQTFNGETETDSFTAGDTITVKATPTATGTAPAKAAARLRADPTAGQMAVYVGEKQVSIPASAGEDGSYTMTVPAAEVLTLGGVEPNGDAITLTAKFVENDNMADGAGTVKVNITAVAKAELDGKVIGYYDESNLDAAFEDSGNAGATITLLADVERVFSLKIYIDCTLDLNGHTITTGDNPCVSIQENTSVTIRGEGEIISEQSHALVVIGSVTLEGGTFTSNGGNSAGVYVNSAGASLSVTGEYVTIRNTGGGYGLAVNSAQSVQLSAGTYKGEKAVSIVSGTTTLSDLLNQEGASRVAYYKDNTALVTEGLDGQTLPGGSYTVKECTHAYQYTHTTGATTHSQTCPACGDAKAAETCSYDAATGRCACGSTLAVTLPADLALTYDGTAKTPAVTVTVDGTTTLTKDTDYSVAYENNVEAGEDTAKVTVTGKTFTGTATLNFSISKASLTIKASDQTITYGGNIATGTNQVTSTGLASGDTLESVTLTPSSDQVAVADKTITPSATVIKRGGEDAAANYNITYQPGALTINKAQAAVTGNPTANTLTYTGAAQALVTAGTASVGDVVYSSAQDGTYTKNIPTGTNAGTYDVWYKVEGTDNYNGTAPAKVAVTINKASHENVTVETSAKFGASRTYDISGLLPDSAELGNITVSGGIFANPQPAVNEGVLSYTLAANQDNVNESGTVTVPVTSSTNYTAFNLIIKITVADVDIPELTVDAISVTYTGQPVSDLKISGTAVSNGTPVKGGWSFAPGQALTDVADSGLKEVIFTPEDSTLYGKAKGYAQVQIGKATPTLRLTASPTATTGGDVTFSLSGLPDGGTANLACSDKDITVTKNQDGTFTANIPQGSTDTTYTFTAAYAGDSNHEKANTSCSVQRKALTELPDPPAGDDTNKFKLVMEEGISEVPAGLKTNESLNTPEKLETVMKTKVMEKTSTIPAANTAVYDVTLLVSDNSGATWAPANSSNFPTGGLTVTLPYPSGTDSSYTFTVVHMFTTNDFSKVIGGTETPAVTNTTNGLQFTVTGLSPISVGWEKKTSQGGGSGGGGGWVSYYTIKVNDSEHGKVTADRTSIYAGGTVTLTVQPDEGYKLEKITVTDSQNKAVELTEKNGKYTFKMPSRDVTVKADFVPADSPSPEPTGSPSPSPSGSPIPTTSPSPSPKPWKNPFPDVSDTGWYIKAVEFVCKNGLMAGYENGKFGPNNDLTRAQFAQIIYNKAGRPQAGSGVFRDVTTGWYANAVNWAAAEGIVTGVGGGKFAPDRPITRQDLAVMLWRYAGSPEPRKNELDFSDAGKTSEYAWKALCWANENDIVSGKGNRILDPKGKATRAEAAQMMMKYLKK